MPYLSIVHIMPRLKYKLHYWSLHFCVNDMLQWVYLSLLILVSKLSDVEQYLFACSFLSQPEGNPSLAFCSHNRRLACAVNEKSFHFDEVADAYNPGPPRLRKKSGVTSNHQSSAYFCPTPLFDYARLELSFVFLGPPRVDASRTCRGYCKLGSPLLW